MIPMDIYTYSRGPVADPLSFKFTKFSILIKPGVEQLVKTKLLQKKTLTAILPPIFVFTVFSECSNHYYSKRFQTNDVTSNVKRK